MMIRVNTFILTAVAAAVLAAPAWAYGPELTHSTAKVVTADTQPAPGVHEYALTRGSLDPQVMLIIRDDAPTDRIELRIGWKTVYLDPWKDYTKMGRIDPNHFIPRAQRLWHSQVTNRAHVIYGSPQAAAAEQSLPKPRIIFEKPGLPDGERKQDEPKIDQPKQVIYQMACAH